MINILNLPVELIYSEKGNNSYEKYVADDPTGINQVLDKMYGAAFQNTQVCLKYSEPSTYFDCAYEMATRIWYQKYPNRYIRVDDVFQCIELSLSKNAAQPEEDDIDLVAVMSFVLLRLRKEMSAQLKEFLNCYHRYLNSKKSRTQNPVLRSVLPVLMEEMGQNHAYDCDLSPKPVNPDMLANFTAGQLPTPNDEQDFVTLFQLYADRNDQLAFYHVLLRCGKVLEGKLGFGKRIGSGEFEPEQDTPRHFQTSEDAPGELQNFVDLCNQEVEHWREKAEYYQKKCECLEKAAQLSSLMDSVSQLGKGIDEHQQQLMDEQKKKYTAMLDERNERLLKMANGVRDMNKRSEWLLNLLGKLQAMVDDGDYQPKTLTLSLTEENIEKLKNGGDVEFDVMENPLTRQPDTIQNMVLCKVLDFLIEYAKDIDMVSETQLPSVRSVLEMLLDNENFTGQMGGDVYRGYSQRIHQLAKERRMRKKDLDKQRHDAEWQEKKSLQPQTIQVQGDLVAQKQMVDKSYGDNYNLEAGATCQQGAAPEQLQTILQKLDAIAPHPILLEDIDKVVGNATDAESSTKETESSRKETGDEHIQ